jgi:pimeloyl-ACP methyl ester carboxylesterase
LPDYVARLAFLKPWCIFPHNKVWEPFMQRFEFSLPQGALSVCQWRQAASGPPKPVLHWAHANGFNGQTYAPLLEPLQDKFDIYAWDARGHGHTSLPAAPKTMTGWDIYANDLEALISHLAGQAGEKIWLGGHSMGGCASILLAAKRPDLVAGLILADPVVTPKINFILQVAMRVMGKRAPTSGLALAEMAAKRKADWPSLEVIQKAYTGRGAFATWEDGFLEAYLRGGLLPKSAREEDGLTLACAPLWEAANFKGPQIDVRRPIARLKMPVTLLTAEHGSTTYLRKPFEKLSVDKKIETVPGTSHFLPMEVPELLRAEICSRAGI